MLAAIVLFTIGSLTCGTAWSMNSLIASRFLQGLGGVGDGVLRHGRERLLQPAQDAFLALVRLTFRLGPVAAAGRQPFDPAVGHRQVGEDELEVEPLEVPRWTHGAALGRELLESMLLARHIDVAAHELKAEGHGHYTITSSGHESNVVLGRLNPDKVVGVHANGLSAFTEVNPDEVSELSEAERKAILGAATLWQFDHEFTARRHDYAGAQDFYDNNSSQNFLSGIRTETLLIHAGVADAFLPPVLARVRRPKPALAEQEMVGEE